MEEKKTELNFDSRFQFNKNNICSGVVYGEVWLGFYLNILVSLFLKKKKN